MARVPAGRALAAVRELAAASELERAAWAAPAVASGSARVPEVAAEAAGRQRDAASR